MLGLEVRRHAALLLFHAAQHLEFILGLGLLGGIPGFLQLADQLLLLRNLVPVGIRQRGEILNGFLLEQKPVQHVCQLFAGLHKSLLTLVVFRFGQPGLANGNKTLLDQGTSLLDFLHPPGIVREILVPPHFVLVADHPVKALPGSFQALDHVEIGQRGEPETMNQPL